MDSTFECQKTLDRILKSGICCGCGACTAICPEGVIRLNFDRDKGAHTASLLNDGKECTGCGLCVQVCPFASVGMHDERATGSDSLHGILNWLIGSVEGVYTGRAKDKKLRHDCSSGGVATALLKYLFKREAIDGAVIVTSISDYPVRHRSFIGKSIADVVKSKGSVYCQIDFSPTWESIENNDSLLAIVGQPCYLRAVDLFVAAKKLDPSKIFKIGLFCGGTSSHEALEYLCKRKGISPANVLSIRYRSGGWPGRRMVVTIPDSDNPEGAREIVLFDKDASLIETYLYRFCFGGSFFLKCCQICKDQTAELADISLGDAWLPEFTSSDTLGTNIIISRTSPGREIVQGAVAHGVIELQDAKVEDVLKSQGSCLVGRKLGLWGRHLDNSLFDVSAAKLCEQYIPQHVPRNVLLLERRSFRWLTGHLPAGFVFALFVSYSLLETLFQKHSKLWKKCEK